MGLFSAKKRYIELFLIFPTDQNGENDRIPKTTKEGDELAIKVVYKLANKEPNYIGEFEGLNIEPSFIKVSELALDTGKKSVTCYDSRKKAFTDSEEANLVLLRGTYGILMNSKGIPADKVEHTAQNFHFAFMPEFGLMTSFRVYKK